MQTANLASRIEIWSDVLEVNVGSRSCPSPSCFDDKKTPCRYDDVGKYLEESSKFSIIHRPSDAIPTHRRIPKSQGSNASYISR
eukprot:scaffold128086_cov46-Attheya_sp.AAC.1